MHHIRIWLANLLLAGTCLARNLPQADVGLAKRDSVDSCKSVLIALKASSFCSSFVPITDSTTTTTATAPTTTVTTTITLPDCTTTVGTTTLTTVETTTVTEVDTTLVTVSPTPVRKRAPVNQATTTTTTKSTTTTTKSTTTTTKPTTTTTTTTKSTTKSTTTTTTASTTGTLASCTIKNLPTQLNPYTCDVIKQACLLFVKPKTTTVTSTVTPTSTASTSTQPPCIPVTASTTTTATTTVTTTSTTTSTSVLPTPSCNGNYATSYTGTRFCQFFAGNQVRNSFAYYTTDFYPGSTSDQDAIQNCANFVSSSGNGVAQTFQVFYVPSEGRWHCDTSLTSNCDSNFTPNTYVNQIYQYNVVGSICGT